MLDDKAAQLPLNPAVVRPLDTDEQLRCRSSYSVHRLLGLLIGPLCLTFFFLVYYMRTGDPYQRRRLLPEWRTTLERAKQYARSKSHRQFRPRLYATDGGVSYEQLERGAAAFDIDGRDVLVFLHIQKTAGTTFETFLMQHLNIERPCVCKPRYRCTCHRNGASNSTWVFSRYSTGWNCGVHADWTEMVISKCVENFLGAREGATPRRRYFYTTFLREPTSRWVSEFRHVQRGATWIQSQHVCNGRPPTADELPMCFHPARGWHNVTLEEFLACPYNMANNRQTRMLADLTRVNCYDRSTMAPEQRDTLMLESAKSNLRKMAWFGIQEDMKASQELFEQAFHLQFTKSMQSETPASLSNDTVITDAEMALIQERNTLDVQLYEYAKRLFDKRYHALTEAPSIGGAI